VIVDGKKIAEEIVATLREQRKDFPPKFCLGVLMGESDTASASFVKIKERVADRLQVVVVRELLPVDATTEYALRALERLSKTCAGLIVQMPLPSQIDLGQILAAIPPHLDVDAITDTQTVVRAPVAEAVSEVFVRTNVSAQNKIAVVVGAGKLVGAPVAELLKSLGADVSVITQNQGSLSDLKNADIVVLGAGEPGLVTPDLLKEGVVLIDAGTSEASGRLAGDADPKCAEVASVFTPVPGGIGPIAVAMIFKNLFILAKERGSAH
jgi:methylenetetrahydrofolate dehydrogenase (NADP+) / methenyltetrahydrofolate cyclohydrolase